MAQQKADYCFALKNETDFICEVDTNIEGWYFRQMYNSAMKKLGKNISLEQVEGKKVQIEKMYYGTLTTMLGKLMKTVAAEVRVDGYKILSYNVESAYFVLKDRLVMSMNVLGTYIKQ